MSNHLLWDGVIRESHERSHERNCLLGVVALGGRTGESVKTGLVPTRAPRKERRSRCTVEVDRTSPGPGARASRAAVVSRAFVVYTRRRRVSLTVLDAFTSSGACKQSWPGAGSERGPGSSYKDLPTRTSAGLGRVSSHSPCLGREAPRRHFRSHGPIGNGGPGEGAGDPAVLKFTCDPDSQQG